MHLHLTVPIEALKNYDYIIISATGGLTQGEHREIDPDLILPLLTPPKVKKITPRAILDVWNAHAKINGWPQMRILSDELTRKLQKAAKLLPTKEHWDHCIEGLLMDPFFSGKDSSYKTNFLTLIYKERYAQFYNDYLAALEGDHKDQTDLALEDWTRQLTNVGI